MRNTTVSPYIRTRRIHGTFTDREVEVSFTKPYLDLNPLLPGFGKANIDGKGQGNVNEVTTWK